MSKKEQGKKERMYMQPQHLQIVRVLIRKTQIDGISQAREQQEDPGEEEAHQDPQEQYGYDH
eukprot:8409600-Prorocentrum_lima.AAC.1